KHLTSANGSTDLTRVETTVRAPRVLADHPVGAVFRSPGSDPSGAGGDEAPRLSRSPARCAALDGCQRVAPRGTHAPPDDPHRGGRSRGAFGRPATDPSVGSPRERGPRERRHPGRSPSGAPAPDGVGRNYAAASEEGPGPLRAQRWLDSRVRDGFARHGAPAVVPSSDPWLALALSRHQS